jgi:iron complex transport system ATP-binding protein
MLEARGIRVRRGAATLIDDVSVTVAPGRILGILGPNGAGKSTLLKVLAGLEIPAEGSVTLAGRPLGAIDRRDRARMIAYLPQQGEIGWAVTVRQLVGLGRLPHGVRPGPEDRAAIETALGVTDMLILADRAVTTLSGGERARALLARALAVAAPVLLADEPLLSLDPCHQLGLMAILRRLADAGSAIGLVLHDLGFAVRFCDEILLLDRGRQVGAGAPAATLSPANLATAYRIEAVSGSHAGEPFLVPWQPL